MGRDHGEAGDLVIALRFARVMDVGSGRQEPCGEATFSGDGSLVSVSTEMRRYLEGCCTTYAHVVRRFCGGYSSLYGDPFVIVPAEGLRMDLISP